MSKLQSNYGATWGCVRTDTSVHEAKLKEAISQFFSQFNAAESAEELSFLYRAFAESPDSDRCDVIYKSNLLYLKDTLIVFLARIERLHLEMQLCGKEGLA